MKTVALTAIALLGLASCGISTPTPPPGEAYARCGKKICVSQKSPTCQDGYAVWPFQVYRKDYRNRPQEGLVYSYRLSNVEAEYKGLSNPGGKVHGGGSAKAPEEVKLLSGSLTVTFLPDEIPYDLDWKSVCEKTTK